MLFLLLHTAYTIPGRDGTDNSSSVMQTQQYMSDIFTGKRLAHIRFSADYLHVTCQGPRGAISFESPIIDEDEARKQIPKSVSYRDDLALLVSGRSHTNVFQHTMFSRFGNFPVK